MADVDTTTKEPALLEASHFDVDETESGFVYRFSVGDHVTPLLKNLDRMRSYGQLVDVTLIGEDGEQFAFHSSLLAAASSVFRDLFVQIPLQFNSLAPRGASSAELRALQRYIYEPEEVVNSGETDSELHFARLCNCERLACGPVDPEQLLATLCAMYTRCELTTSVATSAGKEIPCHSEILAASSPVLLDRILPDVAPLADGQIALDDVTPEVMSVLVNYLYSAELRLCDDTVAGVMTTAVRWHFPAACGAGCDYLRRKLEPHNAIGCAQFAARLLKEAPNAALETLLDDVRRYIVVHLKQVLAEDEFFTIASREDIERSVLSSRVCCSLSVALEKTTQWYYRSQAVRGNDFLQLITGLCFLHCRDDFFAVISRMKARSS